MTNTNLKFIQTSSFTHFNSTLTIIYFIHNRLKLTQEKTIGINAI